MIKRLTRLIMPISCFLILGCSLNKGEIKECFGSCSSGYVLIVFMGEQTKPIYPILISSNEKDTAYFQYIGNFAELLNKNGFVISETMGKEHLRKVIVNDDVFSKIKKYILSQNTHKDTVSFEGGYNTFKIIFADKCDSLNYLVDKTDRLYFKNLIDSVKPYDNNQLALNLQHINIRQQCSYVPLPTNDKITEKDSCDCNIDSITVLYYNFSFTSIKAIRCNDIVKTRIADFRYDNEGIYDAKITDCDILSEIEKEITSLYPDTLQYPLEARISVNIYFKDRNIKHLCMNDNSPNDLYINDVRQVVNNRLIFLIKNNIGYYSWFDNAENYMEELRDTTFIKEPFIISPYYTQYMRMK